VLPSGAVQRAAVVDGEECVEVTGGPQADGQPGSGLRSAPAMSQVLQVHVTERAGPQLQQALTIDFGSG
jgi:hypothetical protein